jgi:hypothetical protein
MFERPAHRAVIRVLSALDASALAQLSCWFGGGTRIAMDLGEYRESRDIDFLCSDASAYADLRVAVQRHGYAALFGPSRSDEVELPREIRADQYGVRFPAVIAGSAIRVELIREARIELARPVHPDWSPVPCLSIGDCYSEKLLANCDRWADSDSLCRDLLDLAALRSWHGPIPDAAWAAAESAYKTAPRDALISAAQAFLSDANLRARCASALTITAPVAERLAAAVRALQAEV